MGRLSGMEISSSPGLKTPLKLAQGQKFLPPKGRRPAGGKYFFPRADLGGFFNPRDEEIFIPDNHGPFGNCIPVRVNQAIFLFFLVIFRLSFDKFLDVQVFSNKNLYKNLQKLVKPQQMKFCPCGNQISAWGVMWKSDFAEIRFLFSSAMTISQIF